MIGISYVCLYLYLQTRLPCVVKHDRENIRTLPVQRLLKILTREFFQFFLLNCAQVSFLFFTYIEKLFAEFDFSRNLNFYSIFR